MENPEDGECTNLPVHLKAIEDRLALDGRNAEEWGNLIREAGQFNHGYARSVYDRFLAVYPTCVSRWIEYIERENKFISLARKRATGDREHHASNLERVFNQCLKPLPSTRLWQLYLDHLRHMAVDREVMIKAYEYSLAHVGLNITSGGIWRDYIAFIRSDKSESSYEETHMLDQLRKAYQRAVAIPHDQLESMWKEYDAFENNLNKITAKKILAERSGMYLTARSFYKELKGIYDQLDKEMVFGEIRGRHDKHQQTVWMKVMEAERRNPLKLEAADLANRVLFAYRLALCYIPGSERVWLDAAVFARGSEGEEAGARLIKQGLSHSPLSPMLSFALAETYETLGRCDEARSVYEALLEFQLAHIARQGEIVNQARQEEPPDAFATELAGRLEEEIGRVQDEHCLAYIQTIRFARRTDGLAAARHYFGRARKLDFCRYQVFVACAQMEYFVGKDPAVAFKIFELGMKRFGDQAPFVKEYMHCLLLHMDDPNARALFERSVQGLESEGDIACLYDMIIEHEKEYGSLPAVREFCARKMAQSPADDEWSLLVQRTDFMGLYGARRGGETRSDAIPQCIQELLGSLPRPSEYMGPVINPNELLSVIERLDLHPGRRIRA